MSPEKSSTKKSAESTEKPSPARRALLTGGAVGLAAVAGSTLGRTQPASAGTTSITVITPTGDTTGVLDTKAIMNALNALTGGGIVYLGPGQFYVTYVSGYSVSGTNAAINVPAQTTTGTLGGGPCCILGSGPATVVTVVGNYTGFYMHRTSGYGPQFNQAADHRVGFLRDFVVDGTGNSGSSAMGVDAGDGWGGVIDLTITNFSAHGQKGLNIANRVFWTEKWHITAHLMNNDTAAHFANAGGASMEYNDIELYVFANGGQNGFQIMNGAYLAGGSLKMRGNFGGTSSTPSNNPFSVITVGNGTSDGSYIESCWLDIVLEQNSSQTYTGTTITFGDTSNYIHNCEGLIAFRNGGSNWSNFANPAQGQFTFRGRVGGNDQTLTSVVTPAVPAANTSYTNNQSDVWIKITGGSGLSVTIDGQATNTGDATYILPMGSAINLGGYTGTVTWEWFPMLGLG